MWQELLNDLQNGSIRSLARSISLVENEADGYESLMKALPQHDHSKILGVTGPPGAGKSTLVDALIAELVEEDKKVGVLCVDPTSPFSMGSLLGDRIRMSQWYNHSKVFIRSLATRGSLGGLNPKIIEITALLKAAWFDYVIVETVGIGQSEVEIAGLADLTIVVLVPEAGDEIQTMKAGVMEIADIFVVNKSDRPGAEQFVHNLTMLLSGGSRKQQIPVPVVKTIASEKSGVSELVKRIHDINSENMNIEKKSWLLSEQAYQLIRNKKMSNINKRKLEEMIKADLLKGEFNLYRFVEQYRY